MSVKLPKLEINSFNGDKLRWKEFWQSFENSIHNNPSLENIDKFNYLRSKITDRAKGAITGLALSNENYLAAVDILRRRFGNVQETIISHYEKMVNLKQANDSVDSLRYLIDTVEKHIRSLEVLGQNVNQDIVVSIVKSKLPVSVICHLEIQKGAIKKWTVSLLRELLTEYVVACERAKKSKDKSTANKMNKSNNTSYTWHNKDAGSAEALASTDKENKNQKKGKQCRYCSKEHWSDECQTYKSIRERKECLKNSCYRYLKSGHRVSECKSDMLCVYCNEKNVHHRSLCPKRFKQSSLKKV